MLLSNTLEQVIKRMRDENLPVFDLYYYVDQYATAKKPLTFDYEAGLDASIAKLTREVSQYPTYRFYVALRPTKNSNKDKIIELDIVPAQSTQVSTPAEQPQSLAGLPGFQGFGAISDMHQNYYAERRGDLGRLQERLDRKEEDILTRERAVNEKQIEYTIKLAQLENERKAFDERVKDTRKDLADLEAKYKSNAEAAKEGFGQFVVKAIELFGKEGDLKGLSGVAGSTTEKLSPEEERVNETGGKLLDIPVEAMNEICSFVDTLADNTKAHALNKNELGQVIAPAFIALKQVINDKTDANGANN